MKFTTHSAPKSLVAHIAIPVVALFWGFSAPINTSHAASTATIFSDPGAYATAGDPDMIIINGEEVDIRAIDRQDIGIILPDGNGGALFSPGGARPSIDPALIEVRELKLKVRELADQLLATMPNDALVGYIAMPTSFVSQDNFDESSSLGRFLGEQLIYEFNHRGFPVREYRMTGGLEAREGEGEFLLSRNFKPISTQAARSVFITGTYYKDEKHVIINARLIRGSDGMILRTGSLTMASNQLLNSMLVRSGRTLSSSSMPIADFKQTITPPRVVAKPQPAPTAIDRGLDIH